MKLYKFILFALQCGVSFLLTDLSIHFKLCDQRRPSPLCFMFLGRIESILGRTAREIIDKVTGILFSANDISSLMRNYYSKDKMVKVKVKGKKR